jgi:hypothetical protein
MTHKNKFSLMKNILILCLLMIASQAFAQTEIIGGSGVCHVDGDPDLSDTLEAQDSRFECQIAYDTANAVIYVYDASGTIGDRWNVFSTDTRVDTAYISSDTLRLVVRQVNDLSVVKTLKVAIPIPPTDLTFTGTTSPITLNSSTGSDVSFKDSTGIYIRRVGSTMTILNTGAQGAGLANRLNRWNSGSVMGYDSRLWNDTTTHSVGINLTSSPTSTLQVKGLNSSSSSYSFVAQTATGLEVIKLTNTGRLLICDSIGSDDDFLPAVAFINKGLAGFGPTYGYPNVGTGLSLWDGVSESLRLGGNGSSLKCRYPSLILNSVSNIGLTASFNYIAGDEAGIYLSGGGTAYNGKFDFYTQQSNALSALLRVGATSANNAEIKTTMTYSPNASTLEFRTMASGTIGEAGRFTSTKNFLVGTTSDVSRVNIAGSGTTSSTYGLIVTNSGGATATGTLVVRDDGNVGFGTNAPETRIHTTGNVLIGATSLSGDFIVFDDSNASGEPELRLNNSGIVNGLITVKTLPTGTGNGFYFNAPVESAARISTLNEIVSVGLNSVGSAVAFSQSTPGGAIRLRPANGSSAYVNFIENGGGYSGSLGFSSGSNTLKYRAGASSFSDGTIVFSITNTGSAMFGGTTDATSRVHIDGANGYTQLRLVDSYTPTATADANGAQGDVAWDDDYIYIKTSAGWKRSALSTF